MIYFKFFKLSMPQKVFSSFPKPSVAAQYFYVYVLHIPEGQSYAL